MNLGQEQFKTENNGSHIHFLSRTVEWTTPQDFFNVLDKEFKFTLDPCCTHENAKCKKHYTAKENGLLKSWQGETVFMNPPYGRDIKTWMRKAWEEGRQGSTVVCLIPARTDTEWWHSYAKKAKEIRFIKGRLKFGGFKNSAPFPSAVVIFKKANHKLLSDGIQHPDARRLQDDLAKQSCEPNRKYCRATSDHADTNCTM